MNTVFFSSHFVGIQNFEKNSQKLVEFLDQEIYIYIYIKTNSNTLVEEMTKLIENLLGEWSFLKKDSLSRIKKMNFDDVLWKCTISTKPISKMCTPRSTTMHAIHSPPQFPISRCVNFVHFCHIFKHLLLDTSIVQGV